MSPGMQETRRTALAFWILPNETDATCAPSAWTRVRYYEGGESRTVGADVCGLRDGYMWTGTMLGRKGGVALSHRDHETA